jgi:hypothetical protein
MAELVEILDGAGIDSSRMSCWIDECYRFINWYLDLPGKCDIEEFERRYHNANHLELIKACLKLETKMDIPFYSKFKVNGK